MIVEYSHGGERKKITKNDSGSSVELPINAADIEVKFQVMRFISTWCDVKKWDRFQRRYVKPKQIHIFKFDKPVTCKFTLSGRLYREAVVEVVKTDEDGQLRNIFRD